MPRHDSISLGELNDSQYYILAALVQPRHGYAVMQMLMSVPNQTVHIGPATLYTTLHKLVDVGLLERCVSEGSSKVYVITADGRQRLLSEIDRKRAMIAYAEHLVGAHSEVR